MSRTTLRGVLVLLAALTAGVAFGQIRSATITGTVTDATGAVVPHAQVTVTELETAISTKSLTTDSGSFTLPYLPAGTYTATISAPGFAEYKVSGIVVATGQTIRSDAQLKLAAVGASVEVQAEAATIQTDSSTVQGTISAKAIDILPNPTSNPLYYAFLQAGVVPRVQAADTTGTNSFGIGTSGRRQFAAVGVNGGRIWTNDIQLDGLPIMSGGYNEVSVTPNTEGLGEVTVIENNFSAQYGHGQGILSMSTKSGTNQYHGEVSYRLRNEALMANSRANKANYSAQQPNGVPRPPFKVNEMGGAVGGPILKDKLFFFTSYHYLRFNRGITNLLTVPTALERQGNFSQTLIRNEAGVGVPAQIYDPWNVTQINSDLYQRALVPNGDLSNYPDARYAQKWFSYYPVPNRTPDDVFNTNNFYALTVQQLRRHNLNTRIDYKHGRHSIYGSGGLTKSSNISPRPYGQAPVNDQPSVVSDNNPFAQVGDTIVLNPTVVIDMRYGISRVNSQNWAGNRDGWTADLYNQFGLPSNTFPLFALFGSAPSLPMTSGAFGKASEHQANHSFSSSITKIKGKWTLKYGFETRNLLSNYTDFEEVAAQFPSSFFDSGGNFNFQYVTANGGSSNQNTTAVQNGITNARYFLAAPGWWIRPGANVRPAFSQKYMAVYAQQDWRATKRLTLNFGLRWDMQPGPTERYDRMSAVDVNAKNPFGYTGSVVFPGVGGYSRNLWNTEYGDIGPRVGGAYQLSRNLVLRGGFGITYLPSNSGYFASPVDYGTSPFSSGTLQQPYGPNPHGVPAIHMYDPAYLNIAPGANPSAPPVYGTSEAKFDRYFRNGRAMQWNFFVERRFMGSWLASIGYSASRSDHLFNRNFAIQNNQLLPTDLVNSWADQFIASNLTLNPATQLIANPFQPTDGTVRNFTGNLGAATIARQSTYNPYPLLLGLGLNQSKAWARYHSMQARLSHAFSHGFQMDLNYTWGKEIDNTDTMEDNQFSNPGGGATGLDIKNLNNNLRLGGSDVKHRVSGVFLYELPFGSGKRLDVKNKFVRQLIGGWNTGSVLTWQTGFPIFISGDTGGALLAHPDRAVGVPLEVPENLQHWYDGNTSVTLPNGRVIKPSKNTFLKYYTGAFQGRYILLPNGKYGNAQNWAGAVANNLDEMRGPGRFNIDMSLRRSVRIRERVAIELSAEASNLLNNSQQSGSYSGNLGNTTVTPNASIGLLPGMGSSDTYGTIGTSTFPPREIVMNLRLRF